MRHDLRASEWDIVLVPRPGKPPLRFRGRRLAQHLLGLDAVRDISIALWQRQKGGLVLVHDAGGDADLGNIVQNCRDIAAAAEWLEQFCAAPGPVPEVTDPSAPPGGCIAAAFVRIQGEMRFRQVFGILAGEAMAAWDGMRPPHQGDRSRSWRPADE